MKRDTIRRALKEFKKYFSGKNKIAHPYLDEYNVSAINNILPEGHQPIHSCVETIITTWYEDLSGGVIEKKGGDGNVIPFPVPDKPPKEPKEK